MKIRQLTEEEERQLVVELADLITVSTRFGYSCEQFERSLIVLLSKYEQAKVVYLN